MEDDDITIDISTILSSTTVTLPSNPTVGDIWFDTSNNSVLTYDNTQWVTVLDNNDIHINTLDFPGPVEWEHEFPAFHKVEEMCKEYPALEKAYENFKTVYTMVKQDWEGKQKERNSV